MRSRDHIDQILHLDSDSEDTEEVIAKAAEKTLNELKRIYESAIKPLETLYKYRDLSNRHFGDPEIFSKPLVLLMGPYSGGKSTIVNYLTGNEYTDNSIRTGEICWSSAVYFKRFYIYIVFFFTFKELSHHQPISIFWCTVKSPKFWMAHKCQLIGHSPDCKSSVKAYRIVLEDSSCPANF